jgi:transcriptional regulator with XRE-family HTH domain
MDDQDPRLLLARRLRALREEHWLGKRITQPQVAQALGGVSVPLISSWESQTNPRIPPPSRLDALAALFATERSFDADQAQLISVEDMSDAERQAMAELKRELTQLRKDAMRAGGTVELDRPIQIGESLSTGPWRFRDGDDITIVCAQWPPDMMQKIPYTKADDPDYIELLTFAELDALFELHGHLRAANPVSDVGLRVATRLARDDYTSHLVTLGGIDWNSLTTSTLERLQLPVRQVADWDTEGEQYYEVDENGTTAQHRPLLGKLGDKTVLQEDVALFARAVNPFNRKRTATICNGMYGRGTYGAVRALTDARFRDRNAEYLRSRFGDSESYCILTRVPIVNGATLTPDWTVSDYVLFEWSG